MEPSNSDSSDTQGDVLAPLVDDAIVLTGPTASGKSDVAIELAQKIDGEILSLDSVAVYRGMDIGSAKPSPDDQLRVVHHLIDVVDPDEEYSVACYLQSAREIVRDLKQRGKRAIFVGGTPMFLKGVLRGFDPGPPADWDFRKAVEDDVKQHGAEALRQRLRQVDPVAAHRIGPNDVRRMTRALEVARWAGQPLTHRQSQFDRARAAKDCSVFAMKVPRAELHARINQRVETMFQSGIVDEVRGLLDRYQSLSRTAAQGVGYRELIEYVRDGGDLDRIKEEIAAHTRQLARRQETWFRSFTEIRPIDAAEVIDATALAEKIAAQVG
ncbi:tRNA (adenosine(37)-N6)-dimethylallyltransferase MiaA [Stieleria marina]|uniref:tRNA (adenosine(37)-N6)-dimethylallyltransferase MiaA n=1 Tax=Stieleria marina TaxID=1930275 RepID=UPI003AF3DC9E